MWGECLLKAFESVESVESIICIVLGVIVTLLTALPPFLRQIAKLFKDPSTSKKLDQLISKIDYIKAITESYKKDLEKKKDGKQNKS